MDVSQHARKQEPSLPEKWQARLALYPESEQPNHIKGVLTSLTDSQYDLQSLLDVYFERWEVEGYARASETLHSARTKKTAQIKDRSYE